MNRVYLDFAASAPLKNDARREMMRVAMEVYGNPSSAHYYGRTARRLIEKAREDIAEVIDCSPDQLFFVPSATVANNIILGKLLEYGDIFLTTKLEHPSVLRRLETVDYNVRFAPLNAAGQVDALEYMKAVSDHDVYRSSVCMVCSETGIINPIKEICKICNDENIFLHTDATQAVGHIPVDINELDIDYMTFAAHKFGGPRGVAVLYDKYRDSIEMFAEDSGYMLGGHQEHGVWPGTENTPAIVGCAAALKESVHNMDAKNKRVRKLRAHLVKCLKQVPGLVFNSFEDSRAVFVVPGILNVSIPGIDGTEIVMGMDEAGFAVSSGSACSTGEGRPSEAILATTGSEERAKSSVRFSFDETVTESELEEAAEALYNIVKKAGKQDEDH